MRGNVKRKYFFLELKCAEDWFSAFSPRGLRYSVTPLITIVFPVPPST
jgi:hypothetical protein